MIFQISRISRTFVQIAENNAAAESQVPGGTVMCTNDRQLVHNDLNYTAYLPHDPAFLPHNNYADSFRILSALF